MLAKITTQAFTTVNKNQMALFNKLTNWWHPSGPSQILYVYNYHRIHFLRKHLPITDQKYPLKNMDILDVGCGAGFLSESMTRLGANVTGLDPSINSYTQASTHKSTKSDLSKLNYENMSLQQYLQKSQNKNKKFDLVTSMEVIEHVNQPQHFLDTISSCTKQGGLVMLSTIRKSPSTWLKHIFLAEKVFGIVPSGTHHHNQFINPEECAKMMRNSGFDPLQILELEINWKGQLQQTKNGGNYLIIGRKQTNKVQGAV